MTPVGWGWELPSIEKHWLRQIIISHNPNRFGARMPVSLLLSLCEPRLFDACCSDACWFRTEHAFSEELSVSPLRGRHLCLYQLSSQSPFHLFLFFGNTLVILLSSCDVGRGVITQIIVAPDVVLYTRPCQSPQSIFLAILKRMKEKFFLDGFTSKWGYDPEGSHLTTIMREPNWEQEEFGEKLP